MVQRFSAPKIEVIRKAIEQLRELEFFYYAPGGESQRVIDALLSYLSMVKLVCMGMV